MNTLGGVHHTPLYWIPRELPRLKPVVAELVGEYGGLGASSSADGGAASLIALIATTYS